MSKNTMIAIIASIVATAGIAVVMAVTATPGSPTQQGNQTATAGGGKKISIELNESLGLKENPPK